MTCPYCEAKALVKQTKHADDYTVRLYRCTVCQSRFYTEESDIDFDRGIDLVLECSKNEKKGPLRAATLKRSKEKYL